MGEVIKLPRRSMPDEGGARHGLTDDERRLLAGFAQCDAQTKADIGVLLSLPREARNAMLRLWGLMASVDR